MDRAIRKRIGGAGFEELLRLLDEVATSASGTEDLDPDNAYRSPKLW